MTPFIFLVWTHAVLSIGFSMTVSTAVSGNIDPGEVERVSGVSDQYAISLPAVESQASRSGPVHALFIFGDSTVDVGNNNNLRSLAKATLWPYGKDFDTHLPTGRFCDGRLSVDYIAEYLGLPLVPPFRAFRSNTVQSQGVNFASAGSGILADTGSIFGDYISFWQQLENLGVVQKTLTASLGEPTVSKMMAESIFYISTGSNDFINNYLLSASPRAKMGPADFQNLVLVTFIRQIRALFKMGARKIVVASLSPLGCLPSQLFKMGSKNGQCIAQVNEMAISFNTFLAQRLHYERRHLPGVKLVYNNAYLAFTNIMENADAYGILHTNRSCCGSGPYGGKKTCFLWTKSCKDVSEYLFWDEFHPTANTYKILAERFWSGPIQVSSPCNLQTLASL